MIQLKGKYLSSVEEFAKMVDFDDAISTFDSEQCETLTEAIGQLHGKFLGSDDAKSLLIQEYVNFTVNQASQLANDVDSRQRFLDQLRTMIESYPRQYTLRVSLPSFPAYIDQDIDIDEDVRLKMRKRRPIAIELAQMMEVQSANEDESETWLEITSKGYGSSSLESPVVASSMSITKHCCFILSSLNIVQATYLKTSGSKAELTDGHSMNGDLITLPAALSRYLGCLIPNEDKLTVFEPGKITLLDGTTRPAQSAEERGKALADIAGPALRQFFSIRKHPDFEQLAAAIEWHQDSRHSENQTFSYLSACIGLEAILGEAKSNMSEMSNRLEDRLAFRMGGDRSSRKQLAETYHAILKLRGNLVHAKAARLKEPEDRRLLREAQRILYNLIWHELKLLYKQSKQREEFA